MAQCNRFEWHNGSAALDALTVGSKVNGSWWLSATIILFNNSDANSSPPKNTQTVVYSVRHPLHYIACASTIHQLQPNAYCVQSDFCLFLLLFWQLFDRQQIKYLKWTTLFSRVHSGLQTWVDCSFRNETDIPTTKKCEKFDAFSLLFILLLVSRRWSMYWISMLWQIYICFSGLAYCNIFIWFLGRSFHSLYRQILFYFCCFMKKKQCLTLIDRTNAHR